MSALGWVTVYKDSIVGSMTERERAVNRARDDETVCAVVPADEWDALDDLDAAIERAAVVEYDRAIAGQRIAFPPGVRFPSWDEISEKDRYRNQVRPIVLAALGRES